MKRPRVIVGIVVLALVALLVVALWPRDPRPCFATFERVREGMTRDEVITTIGAPPGDYSTKWIYFGHVSYGFGLHSERWVCDEAECRVRFGDDGRAAEIRVRKPAGRVFRSRPTPSERVQQWLEL